MRLFLRWGFFLRFFTWNLRLTVFILYTLQFFTSYFFWKILKQFLLFWFQSYFTSTEVFKSKLFSNNQHLPVFTFTFQKHSTKSQQKTPFKKSPYFFSHAPSGCRWPSVSSTPRRRSRGIATRARRPYATGARTERGGTSSARDTRLCSWPKRESLFCW